MTGEIVAADIRRYERSIERSKKYGFEEYIPHFESIIKSLKAIQELDARVE